MTTKEKVLKVHPDAESQFSGFNWGVRSYKAMEVLGVGNSEEAAWQNAAESLPSQPEQEIIEGAELAETEKQRSESSHKYLDDAWIREMAEKEDGCLVSAGGLIADIEPVESLPVESKEKNRLTYEETRQRFGLPVAEPKPTPPTPAEHPRADCEGCNKPDCPCNSLEEAMKLHGEDEIVGCYLGEFMIPIITSAGDEQYEQNSASTYMDALEAKRDDAQRRANLAIGCLEVKEQLNDALRAKDEKNKALHREIIDQGRKVLNATSEIGMSHAEYIEWVLERLEEKL